MNTDPQNYPPAFIDALACLLGDEGGFSDAAGDPGGPTRFGISERSYPELDLAALTRAQAAAIYYRDWWLRYRLGDLAGPIATKMLVLAVNMGDGAAVICLQRGLRACSLPVAEDGDLGPVTLAAAQQAGAGALLPALRAEAAGHYRMLAALDPESVQFLNGWLNRAYQ